MSSQPRSGPAARRQRVDVPGGDAHGRALPAYAGRRRSATPPRRPPPSRRRPALRLARRFAAWRALATPRLAGAACGCGCRAPPRVGRACGPAAASAGRRPPWPPPSALAGGPPRLGGRRGVGPAAFRPPCGGPEAGGAASWATAPPGGGGREPSGAAGCGRLCAGRDSLLRPRAPAPPSRLGGGLGAASRLAPEPSRAAAPPRLRLGGGRRLRARGAWRRAGSAAAPPQAPPRPAAFSLRRRGRAGGFARRRRLLRDAARPWAATVGVDLRGRLASARRAGLGRRPRGHDAGDAEVDAPPGRVDGHDHERAGLAQRQDLLGAAGRRVGQVAQRDVGPGLAHQHVGAVRAEPLDGGLDLAAHRVPPDELDERHGLVVGLAPDRRRPRRAAGGPAGRGGGLGRRGPSPPASALGGRPPWPARRSRPAPAAAACRPPRSAPLPAAAAAVGRPPPTSDTAFATFSAALATLRASLTPGGWSGPAPGARSMNTQPTWGTGLPPMSRPLSNSHGYSPWNSWNESLDRIVAPARRAICSTNPSPRPMAPGRRGDQLVGVDRVLVGLALACGRCGWGTWRRRPPDDVRARTPR